MYKGSRKISVIAAILIIIGILIIAQNPIKSTEKRSNIIDLDKTI